LANYCRAGIKSLRGTVFLFWEINVSVSDLYIPRIGPHISCSRIGRSVVRILYINHSHTCEFENLDCGRAIPFLGIFVYNFPYWFFAVYIYSILISRELFTIDAAFCVLLLCLMHSKCREILSHWPIKAALTFSSSFFLVASR
jgi:hypothetical protein